LKRATGRPKDLGAVGEMEIQACPEPWSFVGELPFQQLDRSDAPGFVLVDVEVRSGTLGVAVLNPAANAFVSERHFQRSGRTWVQLPLHDLPARSVVFCNAAASPPPVRRLHERARETLLELAASTPSTPVSIRRHLICRFGAWRWRTMKREATIRLDDGTLQRKRNLDARS
jgi:hypothetical protein